MRKISHHPILEVPVAEKLQFVFEGKIIEGEKGFTIAAALHQAGYPKPITEFLAGVRSDVLNDRIQIGELTVLIHLMILLAGSNQQDRETKQS